MEVIPSSRRADDNNILIKNDNYEILAESLPHQNMLFSRALINILIFQGLIICLCLCLLFLHKAKIIKKVRQKDKIKSSKKEKKQ